MNFPRTFIFLLFYLPAFSNAKAEPTISANLLGGDQYHLNLLGTDSFSPNRKLHLTKGKRKRKSRKKTLSQSEFLLGGFIGTFLGYGSGHAIQGRYLENGGWKYTVAPFVVGLSAITLSRLSQGGSKNGHGGGFLFLLGFVVVRVFEIVDVWRAPGYRIQDNNAFLKAGDGNYQIGLNFKI